MADICPRCDGSGVILVSSFVDASTTRQQTCSICKGSGRLPPNVEDLQARIAALESSLSFKSAQVDRIVVEEAAATKAAKDRAKKAEASLATCRSEAKAEGIREAAAVCRVKAVAARERMSNPEKWNSRDPEYYASHQEGIHRAHVEDSEAILALLPPDPPEDKG